MAQPKDPVLRKILLDRQLLKDFDLPETGEPPEFLQQEEERLAAVKQGRPALPTRFGKKAASRTGDIAQFLHEINPNVLGRRLMGEQPTKPFANVQALEDQLPEAAFPGEKFADLAGRSAPDVALGLLTAPVASAGATAAAARGAGPIVQILAGEALQSAALAPIEFGTRPPLEAAAATVLAPLAGTILNRAGAELSGRAGLERQLQGALKDVGQVAREALGEAPAETIEKASREMKARAMLRLRQSIERDGSVPADLAFEMDDEIVEAAAREAKMELYQRSVAALRGAGVAEEEAASTAEAAARWTADFDMDTHGLIADSIASLPPAAADKFIRQLAKGVNPNLASAGAKIREFRSAAMLSGFGTHFRNIAANAANVISKPGRTAASAFVDTALTGADKGVKFFTGAPVLSGKRQRFFKEAPAEAAGMVESLAQRMGMQKALAPALKTLGLKARAAREIADKQAIGGVLGKVTGSVHRALNAVDRFYYETVFNGEINRQAARKALQEGAHGKQFASRMSEILANQEKIARRIYEAEIDAEQAAKGIEFLKGKPGAERGIAELRKHKIRLTESAVKLREASFVPSAAKMADRTVFTAREGEALDKMLDAVDEMSALSPLINTILPFRRTPANIARETLRSTPVGFLTGLNRARQALAADVPMEQVQGRLSDDFGQALVGTAALYTMLHMVESGYIKVNPFKLRQRAERTTEEAAGVVPDSVVVGNYSLPISRFEPIGSMLLAAGRLSELKAGENPPDDAIQELHLMSRMLGLQALNENFFDPLAEFFEATTGDDRTMARYMQRLGGSFMPRIVSQIDQRAKEPPTQEDVANAYGSDLIAGFRHQIPGRGQAQLGLFGEERKPQAPYASLLFGKSGKVGNNPIAQEMARVGAYHAAPTGFSSQFKAKLEKLQIGLSPGEERDLRVTKGKAQELAIKALMESPTYTNLPHDAKGEQARKALIDYTYKSISTKIDNRAKALKLAKVPLTSRAILGL